MFLSPGAKDLREGREDRRTEHRGARSPNPAILLKCGRKSGSNIALSSERSAMSSWHPHFNMEDSKFLLLNTLRCS